jgi:hypothetical protein
VNLTSRLPTNTRRFAGSGRRALAAMAFTKPIIRTIEIATCGVVPNEADAGP